MCRSQYVRTSSTVATVDTIARALTTFCMPPSLTRDIDRLSCRTFDLLVVGGGIYGLTVACDATRRGLAVALIEKHDFGSGTSFNHLRTIHGGLRYLQTLTEIASEKNSTIIFPLPIELLNMLGARPPR